MPISDEDKFFADLWVKQYDIFFRIVSLVPLGELAILAGWYTLMKDGHTRLAQGMAMLGAFVMIVAWASLRRTTRYIRYFRKKLEPLLEGAPPVSIKGRWIGTLLPIAFTLLNLVLASGKIEITPSQATQTDKTGITQSR